MAWIEENDNMATWSAETNATVANYTAQVDKMGEAYLALENAIDDPEVMGPAGDQSVHIEVPDDEWAAFNEEFEATKAYEQDVMSQLPMVKNFRQHALNVAFSHEFKALEKDFKTVVTEEHVAGLVNEYQELLSETKSLPRISADTKAMIEASPAVVEALTAVDITMNALKTGDLEPTLDYLINGESDGTLQPVVTGATVEHSEGVKNATGENNNTTAEGASGLAATVVTALITFAASQF